MVKYIMNNIIKISTIIVGSAILIKCFNYFNKSNRKKDNVLRLVDDIDPKSIFKSIVAADNTFLNNMDKIKTQLDIIPDDNPLNIVVTTFGGSLFNCSWLITLLKARTHPYRIYIKDICMSAGTLIALGAFEIIMLPNKSFLGKIDPQISVNGGDQRPTINFIKALDKTKKELSFSENVVVSVAESVINEIDYIINKLNLPPDLLNIIKSELIYSNFPHEHKFDIDDCRKMGLNIREPKEDELVYFD